MPKLWSETIEGHRREVRDAILDTAAALTTQCGLLSVTMSQIAEDAGIGRATLYKYFGDVESIVLAWHERQVAEHLAQLAGLRDKAGDARGRLHAVLEAYAFIRHEHHGTEVAALVHHGGHLSHVHDQLSALVADLLGEAAETGSVRDDVPPDELAIYCLHAVSAAADLPSKAAVRRLIQVILAGLRSGPTAVKIDASAPPAPGRRRRDSVPL